VLARQDRQVPLRLLRPLLFGTLVAASVIVAAIVLTARSPDLEIRLLHMPKVISPNGDGRGDMAHIRFFVRDGEPDATVEIVGPNVTPVRTLAEGLRLEPHEPVAFTWNGRTDAGRLADPRDRYRLRVIMPSQDRDVIYPRRITLRDAR
jgi:hypothetical protein